MHVCTRVCVCWEDTPSPTPDTSLSWRMRSFLGAGETEAEDEQDWTPAESSLWSGRPPLASYLQHSPSSSFFTSRFPAPGSGQTGES